MTYSVAGVPDLDNRLMGLRESALLEWLRSGFTLLGSEDLVARGAAFPPLSLNPERELLAQLATALREAEAAGLQSTDRLRSVVINRLSDPDAVRRERIEDLTRFWQLLASIRCEASIFAVGRAFLAEALRTRPTSIFASPDRDKLHGLVGAIVAAVVTSSPMGAAQLSFMDFVRRHGELWSEGFVDLVVDCAFSAALRPAQRQPNSDNLTAAERTWQEVRDMLGLDLDRRADPSTAVGRALIRSIARYIGANSRAANNRADIAALKGELWSIGKDDPWLVIEHFVPSRELELA